MRNSIAVGRRLAARIVFAQVGATFLVAVPFLAQGWRSAIAVLCCGMMVAIGNALLASRLFTAVLPGAGYVLTRLLVGIILKWMVIIGGLYLLIEQYRLPLLPTLSGLIVALVVQVIGLRFKDH